MFNIAIDGPAGAGKSTIAKLVAKKMGFIYVDTGAMYRTMAYKCLISNIDVEDEEAVSAICTDANIRIEYVDGTQKIFLDEEDVSELIRKEEVGNCASVIAKYQAVREQLVKMQKNIATENNVIMDGRDIGTTVLPNADLKIYLTASSATRAKRRFDELTAKGVACNLDEIEKDIIERDTRDMNRKISPLVQAEDAMYLDSSNMTIDEVVNEIISLAK